MEKCFLSKLKHNNDGSTIISVVVAMIFIVALGCSLLFVAFTSYKISIAQRNSAENFYDASSAMDDVRIGVQNTYSDSVSSAYTSTILEYGRNPSQALDTAQEKFSKSIWINLSIKNISNTSLFNRKLTDKNFSIADLSYNPDALIELIPSEHRKSCTLSGDGTVSSITSAENPDIIKGIILENIILKYIEDGYETTISTDLQINAPNFFSVPTTTTNVNALSLVAHNNLTLKSNSSITGDAFIGSGGIIKSGTNVAKLKDGDVICKGPVKIKNGSFIFGEQKKSNPKDDIITTTEDLWIQKLCVGDSKNNICSVEINGNTYVRDDLVMDCKKANVTLSGRYFGFGDSITKDAESSSIIVNHKDASLDISGLSHLSLAGMSFINVVDDSVFSNFTGDTRASKHSSPLMMGESLSVKPNQLAYLIPAGCIENYGTNPKLFTNDTNVESPKINKETIIWKHKNDDGSIVSKTLGDYLTGKSVIKPLYRRLNGSGDVVTYVFIEFDTRQAANKYFKDYFEAQPENIEGYFNSYLKLSKTDAITLTAGNMFVTNDEDPDDKKDVIHSLVKPNNVWASNALSKYNNMVSPWNSIVKGENFDALKKGIYEFKIDEKLVAVIAKGQNYIVDINTPKSLCLIISSDTVNVDSDFNGVILANDITVSGNISSRSIESSIITTKDSKNDLVLSDFIKGSSINKDEVPPTDSWDFNNLVVYNNWQKNPEVLGNEVS